MNSIALKTNIVDASLSGHKIWRPLAALLAAMSVSLLAGCAHRDSITVGAVPDDYRTNHPIVIAEQAQVIDLPVASGDRGMTHSQRVSLDGFLDGYDRSASPVVTITVPVGSGNELAAGDAAADFRRFLRSRGVRVADHDDLLPGPVCRHFGAGSSGLYGNEGADQQMRTLAR